MTLANRRLSLVGLLVLAGFLSTGCSYMQDRGRDAMDVFDVGITVSEEPGFSLYAGFLNILSLGYSNVDGNIIGIGGREAGIVPMRQNAGGLLLWGYEQMAYGEGFDPKDPDSPEPWHVGVIGLIQGPRPDKHNAVNCPKLLHLGWVGLTLNCKFAELADFLLGWTTMDIMCDDVGKSIAQRGRNPLIVRPAGR